MLIIDLLDCGIEFEARLTDQAILFTMFAGEIFLINQQAKAFNERQSFVGTYLRLLRLQRRCHAAKFELT